MNSFNILKSKRFWIALVIFTGVFFIKNNPLLIGIILITFASFYDIKTIRPLKNYKFWVVIVLLIIVVPLFTGKTDKTILGISYSGTQLQKSLSMTVRGISMFLLFQVLTLNLKVEKIKLIFKYIGLKNFDILYDISNDIFPKIKSILLARYGLFKEIWRRRKTLNTLLSFIIDIFSDFFDLIDQLCTSVSSVSVPPKELLENINTENNLVLITGDAGTGKTTWIEEFIKQAEVTGLTIDGLYSKKVIEPNGQWYHNLICVSTNNKRQLNTMKQIETVIKVGKFFFYADTINWGNKQLKSVDEKSTWIILDEIGLLEFNGGGFLQGLQQIESQNNYNLILTIRYSLLKHVDKFINENIPSLGTFNKHIIKL